MLGLRARTFTPDYIRQFLRYLGRSRVESMVASEMVDTSARIAALRQLMQKPENNLQAYVVPSEDQHSSEYLADCDARRLFISGFSGSAGLAVITATGKSSLFTDGRYFLQASKQLDTNWTLQKQGLKGVPTWQEFLEKNIAPGSRIGVDPTLVSASEAKAIAAKLEPKGSLLVPLSENLVDAVWGSDRPARPETQVFPLDIKYTGRSSLDKLKELRSHFAKNEACAMVVSMLDEVAWLFNLRASDISFNPVFFAYAVVTADRATLFVNEKQVDAKVHEHLGDHVDIRPYEEVLSYIEGLKSSSTNPDAKKVLISKQASWSLLKAIGENNAVIVPSPIAEAKAIKNEVEAEGFRQSHIRDGVALAQYFAWLEEQLESGVELTEHEGATVLENYRSTLKLFKGLSFDTISSTGPNAAVIHYQPPAEGSSVIRKEQVYLCDSGGQFMDGTTDVTRTWHFGVPTSQEKRAFTRVLQGHISIDTAVIPHGTTGYVIDSFARRALWQDGLDYRHGTGHGVGSFLNVHEGPQGIGTRIAYNDTGLKPGMVLSNEPGYYEEGKFGIRIENVCIVRTAKTLNTFDERGYLAFEHFTLCPIQTKLVDTALMSSDEIRWLNNYHNEVLEKILPLVLEVQDKRAAEWLRRECASI